LAVSNGIIKSSINILGLQDITALYTYLTLLANILLLTLPSLCEILSLIETFLSDEAIFY